MNTSDLMPSGAALSDAASLPAHVAGGPGCGAKRISDATAEERAGGAAAFAGHLRRVDGGGAEHGAGEGRRVDEPRRDGAEAAERAAGQASAVGSERDATSRKTASGDGVAEPSAGASGAAVASGASGRDAASATIDGADDAGAESLLLPTSPSTAGVVATRASLELSGARGNGDEAPVSGAIPTSGPSRGDERLADGAAALAAANAHDGAEEALLATGEGIVRGANAEAPTPTEARHGTVGAAVRNAMAAGSGEAGAASSEPLTSMPTLEATSGDGRAIELPVIGVSPAGAPSGGVAAADGPTLGEEPVGASMTARAPASTLRAGGAATSAAAASAPTVLGASAVAPAAAGAPRPGSSSAAATLAAPSTGAEPDPLADARTDAASASRSGGAGRTDTAASLVAPTVTAESPTAALTAAESTAAAGTPPATPSAVSAQRATAQGVAAALAPTAASTDIPVVTARPGVDVLAADATTAIVSAAPSAGTAAGARGGARGAGPVSGADVAESEAAAPVLVADVLRKRQVETTRRVEATRDGRETSAAAERRLGPIPFEVPPLADARDGDALAARSTSPSLSLPGTGTPIVPLPAQQVGAPLATRVDTSPSPAPIAPHNVSLGGGSDASELAASVRWTFGEGRGQALVNVTPAGLGPVSIRVSLEGDQMNVSILASQVGAREALESLVPRLREQLAAEGHERVQVDVSSGRQDGQARADARAQDHGERSGTGRATEDDANTRDVESLAQQGAPTQDGTGRDGAVARSLIDAWA